MLKGAICRGCMGIIPSGSPWRISAIRLLRKDDRPTSIRFIQCYLRVICDAGSTFNLHWLNASCSLTKATVKTKTFFTAKANTTHSFNVGLMLGQGRRRWPNIEPALVECIVCLDSYGWKHLPVFFQ